jgi:hypothetical protein
MNTDTRLAPRSPERTLPVEAEPTLGTLATRLAQDSSTLIKQEIALAKAEARQSVRQAANGVMKLGIAAAVLGIGTLVLIAFLVLLLGELMGNYWAAALIVGLLLSFVGALLAIGGLRRLKQLQIAPGNTIETLKEDKAWAQSEISRVKHDLRP